MTKRDLPDFARLKLLVERRRGGITSFNLIIPLLAFGSLVLLLAAVANRAVVKKEPNKKFLIRANIMRKGALGGGDAISSLTSPEIKNSR